MHHTAAEPFYRLLTLRSGLTLYAADEIDHDDRLHQTERAAGLCLPLVISGGSQVEFGDQAVELGVDGGGQCRSALLSLAHGERFARRLRPGLRRRVCSLTMPQAWLESGPLGDAGLDAALRRFSRQHLARRDWTLPAGLVARVNSLFAVEGGSPLLHGLLLESRCLEIVSEALTSLFADVAPQQRALSSRELRAMQRVRELLASGDADDWSLDAIAAEVGMSSSTLQRHFRRFAGVTVGEYLRELRLQRAAAALRRDRVPVLEASLIAGYGSAANFATAFRRRFGITPQQWRRGGL